MGLHSFTFHYGSIKGKTVLELEFEDELFTFHYGSIKGLSIVVFIILALTFTFHYGSIKGSRATEVYFTEYKNLHSTMVLLKDY